MTEYDLKLLRAAGERAIASAHQNAAKIAGAINWGDLHCVAALRVEDDQGEIHYRVEIEEAAPDNDKLSRHVSEYLTGCGFPGVEVYTEW